MNITINGTQKDLSQEDSLENIVNSLSKDPGRIIAEVNGQIIKKPDWPQTRLKNGDIVELVSFVGGG